LLCLRNARAFPLLPAALASVPFGFVLVRVRVPWEYFYEALFEKDSKASTVLISQQLRICRRL